MPGLKTSAEDLAARRANRRTTGLLTAVEPHVEADSVTTVELSQLAPHPNNRRSKIGDVSDIAQSMRALGVLEPLVVTTRAAHLETYPHHAEQIGTADYVVICGHRRRVAAGLAELTRVPISIQPDLSRDGRDVQAMIVENARRSSLNPLDEALGYAELIERGHKQTDIAEAIGVTQGQISKRLKLLDLPEPIREALAGDRITVHDALTIGGKLRTADDQLAAWAAIEAKLNADAAKRTGQSGDTDLDDAETLTRRANRARVVAEAVAAQVQTAKYAERAAASRAKAADEGVPLVDPVAQWGPGAVARRLDDAAAVARAREAGDLAAALDEAGGLFYVLAADAAPEETAPAATAPARVDGGQAPRPRAPEPAVPPAPSETSATRHPAVQDPEAGERAEADRGREAACQRIAARKPAAADALRRIAGSLVILGAGIEAHRLAFRWLREAGIGPDVNAAAGFADAVNATGGDLAAHFAYAIALAGDELHTRKQCGPWDQRAREHALRLMTDADYVPSAYEARYTSEQPA